MGGGRRELTPDTQQDPEYPGLTGRRTDGRNIINEWKRNKNKAEYVWNQKQLEEVMAHQEKPEYLMGKIFSLIWRASVFFDQHIILFNLRQSIVLIETFDCILI